MAKEWVLNSATNRFQLNFKRNVGPTSYNIRKCQPKSSEDWKKYYFEKVYPEVHLESLGRKLYVKITEVLVAEIEEITEEDCIEYIKNLIINRTYDGYVTEIRTIYGQLQEILSVPIKPASDEWDRLFNVDFFIKIGNNHIGIQIKPASDVSHIPQIFKERDIQKRTHEEFRAKYGGNVFYVISLGTKDKKTIQNPEVIDEIRAEIERLKKLSE